VIRYATNLEVTRFFASHGIPVTDVRQEGMLRHLRVNGQPITLPMPASPDECLRLVRDCIAAQQAARPPVTNTSSCTRTPLPGEHGSAQ
jgi:hypothetical protein